MDERVKNVYNRIYAELFRLTLLGCCLSVIVKFAILDMNVSDCILEYLILVISPVYLLIRSRMLGVTGAARLAGMRKDYNKRFKTALISGLILSMFVITAILRNRGESVEWTDLIGAAVPFVVCFCAVHVGFRKWEEWRQKKLDDRYGDE